MSTSTVTAFFDGLKDQAFDLLVYAWTEMFPVIILVAVIAMLIGVAYSIIHLGKRKRR